MNPEQNIQNLEQTKDEIIRFTNQLDQKLHSQEIDGIEYHLLLNEKLNSKTKKEVLNYIDQRIQLEQNKIQESHNKKKRKTSLTLGAAAIIIILMAIIGIIYQNPDALTGFTTLGIREKQESIEYNRIFDHYTETQLNITNITSLKISGVLEGTGANVKLRIGDTEYLVADLTNQAPEAPLITGLVIGEEEPQPEYALSTDKEEYTIRETVTLTIEPPAENVSYYIETGTQRIKQDDNTYLTEQAGEHQAIALIVLPDDILRLETSFTVLEEEANITINESINDTVNETTNITINETINQTINESNETNASQTITLNFSELCTETCNLIETSNPILIIELEENTTLTIIEIIVVQNKENQAPTQIKNIPDINITATQTATLNLDEYFTDPDQDALHYDINEIPEISTEITQEILTISSGTKGNYLAYIYITDGDQLITSNTFQIIITQEEIPVTNETNQTIPEINITTNETNQTQENITITDITSLCSHPNPNMRPPECIEGQEEQYFKDRSYYLKDDNRKSIARITAFGNLVITGSLIQNSTTSPGSDDFKIGYALADGETSIVTAWIVSETGDLHLRGNLHEEQFTLIPSNKVFLIQNRKGTNLGYFDRTTGDLYLRGNLIQKRPEPDVTIG